MSPHECLSFICGPVLQPCAISVLHSNFGNGGMLDAPGHSHNIFSQLLDVDVSRQKGFIWNVSHSQK